MNVPFKELMEGRSKIGANVKRIAEGAALAFRQFKFIT